MTSRVFTNPLRARDGAGLSDRELDAVAAFAAQRTPAPLYDAPGLAQALGLSRLLIKDETHRWGLNSFKITGVSYALDRWLAREARRPPHALVCASAGNHGRAVARAARDRELSCRVFLPSDALPARAAAIRDDGADVVQIGGSYEDAVDRATADAGATGALLVSDTADASGAQEIPTLIMHGYTAVFSEAAAMWPEPPDVIVVQAGVGGLAGAAAAWVRTRLPAAVLIAAEPVGAACLRGSAEAGRRTALPRTEPTSMVCLRCAAPSAAAWPSIAAGVDGFVTVQDHEAASAVAALAGTDLDSGASGACGLAALRAIAPEFAGRRALIVITEGP